MTEYDHTNATPASAIQCAIFDLCEQRHDWLDKPDPHGVLKWIDNRIAALEQAQRDLEELQTIKQALAILKASVL